MKQHDTIAILNGSHIVATIHDVCWIESEKSFYGKDRETGDRYYVWDISREGYATSYRRCDE